jgi:hypothetical protein
MLSYDVSVKTNLGGVVFLKIALVGLMISSVWMALDKKAGTNLNFLGVAVFFYAFLFLIAIF